VAFQLEQVKQDGVFRSVWCFGTFTLEAGVQQQL